MASVLGMGEECHVEGIRQGRNGFRPAGELFEGEHPWQGAYVGWLKERSLLSGRRQGPASQLALMLAGQAAADAGWSDAELRDCAVIVGSSRGNAAGWLDDWPGRRRVKLLSAPNSLHSELASTISIEMGIEGPYHVLSSGCAAGLDALGFAGMLIKSGVVERALAVGLDLPLTPELLDTYWASRMLSPTGKNDPYHAGADGMLISEGGAAMALCSPRLGGKENIRGFLVDYRSNSDASHPLGMRADGRKLGELLEAGLDRLDSYGLRDAAFSLCPHASGTKGNAVSERAAWDRAFGPHGLPDIRMIKPYVGHTIGGSGILELAIFLAFLNRGEMPPHPPGLVLPGKPGEWDGTGEGVVVMKTAASMGGHNALASVLSRKSEKK